MNSKKDSQMDSQMVMMMTVGQSDKIKTLVTFYFQLLTFKNLSTA